MAIMLKLVETKPVAKGGQKVHSNSLFKKVMNPIRNDFL